MQNQLPVLLRSTCFVTIEMIISWTAYVADCVLETERRMLIGEHVLNRGTQVFFLIKERILCFIEKKIMFSHGIVKILIEEDQLFFSEFLSEFLNFFTRLILLYFIVVCNIFHWKAPWGRGINICMFIIHCSHHLSSHCLKAYS